MEVTTPSVRSGLMTRWRSTMNAFAETFCGKIFRGFIRGAKLRLREAEPTRTHPAVSVDGQRNSPPQRVCLCQCSPDERFVHVALSSVHIGRRSCLRVNRRPNILHPGIVPLADTSDHTRDPTA